jgi:hypothetical protein
VEVSFKEGSSIQGGKTNRREEKGKSSSPDKKKNKASSATSYSTYFPFQGFYFYEIQKRNYGLL